VTNLLEHDLTQTIEKKKHKEIDLKEIFSIIKRQIWIIIILAIFGAAIGAWYSETHKPVPVYQSSTQILVWGNNSLSTLMVMFTDPTVIDEVSQKIGNPRSPGQISSELSITNPNQSQIISIQVTDTDPTMAAQIANIEVAAFENEVTNVLKFSQMRQLASAKVNPVPINQTVSHKKILYGLIGGLVLGLFLGFLRNSLDDSIRTEKELERLLELPVVGSISIMTTKNSRKYKSKRTKFLELFRISPSKGKKDQREELKTIDEFMETPTETASSLDNLPKASTDNY
jgi:capsular polysaccharide biosynthesis protein